MEHGVDSLGRKYPLRKPKQSLAMRKVWEKPESRERMVVAATKATTTVAYRRKQSRLLKKISQSPKRKKELLRASSLSHTYETKLRRKLESEGWRVLHRGWPDFIAIRGNKVRFIEAKEPNGKPSRFQKEVHKILSAYGIVVEVLK